MKEPIVEPDLFVRMTKQGEDRLFYLRSTAEDAPNMMGPIIEYVRMSKVKALLKDAARYQHLRNQAGNPTGADFDAMIDRDIADTLGEGNR